MSAVIYGIGNPLIDILIPVSDSDLQALNLNKGTMHLIDLETRKQILDYFHNNEKTYSPGGSCPNTIITLCGLGVQGCLSGRVSRDEYGDIYINQAKKLNVISELKQAEGVTGSSIILISEDSERTMNTYLGINREYSKDDISPDHLAAADYLYFTGYMWDTESQKEALLESINLAKENNTKIVFDVADPFAVGRNKEEFLQLIDEHIDILFANNEEAKILFDNDNPQECAAILAKKCETAIVKDGSRGSFVANGSSIYQIPVNKVQSVDTTGAGDTYAAGFLFGIIQGYSLKDSGLFASYLASQIVTVRGAQFSNTMIGKIRSDLDSGTWRYI